MLDRNSAERWQRAVAEKNPDIWVDYLESLPVSDFFDFVEQQRANAKQTKKIDQWLNDLAELPDGGVFKILDASETPIIERLSVATFNHWVKRVKAAIQDVGTSNLPTEGVLNYFSDQLRISILVQYRWVGSAVELEHFLTMPSPDSLFDPRQALTQVR